MDKPFWKSQKEKLASQYFINMSRLGGRADRSVPVANTVGESLLLGCLLEKETIEFCLEKYTGETALLC